MDKELLKALFEQHTDGIPENVEDFLNKDLYKEQAFVMLVDIVHSANLFEEKEEK